MFSFLEGKAEGEWAGIKAWDKDDRTFIRAWKHGFSHSEAGLEKYHDSRDRLSILPYLYSVADKARASLPKAPRFGSKGAGLPKASFLERLRKLSTNTQWLEWASLSAGLLLSYGLLKRNQHNGLKKQIKMLQYGLQNLQKKEEKVFLHSIATLGVAAVSIPLEPFWSNWGYKQGYKKVFTLPMLKNGILKLAL